jgi:hypothetical protein
VDAALSLGLLYFRGYDPENTFAPRPHDLRTTLKASLAAQAAGVGQEVAAPLWPYSGLLIFGLMALSAGALLLAVVRPRQALDRPRAVGLLFFQGGVITAALALGYGRGGLGLPYNNEYAILGTLGLCLTYLVWSVYRPATVGLLVQMSCFTLLLLAVPVSLVPGLAAAQRHHAAMEAFLRDLHKGLPPHLLVVRHGRDLHEQDGFQGTLAELIGLLHRNGVGPFREGAEDQAFPEVPVPLSSAAVTEMTWQNGKGHGEGPDASLTFQLPQPRLVAGLKIRWSHSNGPTAHIRVSWRSSGMADFPAEAQYQCPAGFLEEAGTVFIADQIEAIRIQPDDKPFDIAVEDLVLLLEPYLEERFREAPVLLKQMTWQDGAGRGLGDDPFLVFALKEPQFLAGICLAYAYEDTPTPAELQVFWRNRGRQEEFVATERNEFKVLPTDKGPGTVIIWINDSIDEFRVDPDTKPCGFKLSAITLLSPNPDAAPAYADGPPGAFDGLADGELVGWVWDPRQPDQALSVDMYDGDSLLATVRADKLRDDLRGKGDGRHGFAYTIPERLKDGRKHTIHVRVAGTQTALPGSPKALRFP